MDVDVQIKKRDDTHGHSLWSVEVLQLLDDKKVEIDNVKVCSVDKKKPIQ